MVTYIIDTYAWIEYFRGSAEGESASKIIHGPGECITMECCLAELKGYCLAQGKDWDLIHWFVRNNSTLHPVLTEHWLDAAQIRFDMRKKVKGFGLIDALLIAKQRQLRCKIVSGDPHFRNVKDCLYIGS